MEIALDIQTNLLVDGEDLWALEGNVDKERYRCPGCGVKVKPASFLKDKNEKRPYFRELQKTDPHKKWCDIAGEKQLKLKAKKQKVFNENKILPSFIPISLSLIDIRRKIDPHAESIVEPTSGRNYNCTAQNIRRLCKYYIDYPYDRNLPLTLPNIGKYSYEKLFSGIPNKIININTSRILFAPIQFSSPKILESEIVIELSRGAWNKEFTQIIEKYNLIIHTSNWSKSKKTMFHRELELVRLQAIHTNNRTKNKSWIFFLGEQDHQDLRVFHVHDHRLVCALFVENLK